MLKSLFKPKWQHPDEAVRQKALTSLDSDQDVELIKKMAIEDPSIKLREQALNKLTDLASLAELLKNVKTPDDWLNIAVKINQLSPQLDNLVNDFNRASTSWSNETKLQAIGKCKDIELANGLLFRSNDVEAFFNLAINAK